MPPFLNKKYFIHPFKGATFAGRLLRIRGRAGLSLSRYARRIQLRRIPTLNHIHSHKILPPLSASPKVQNTQQISPQIIKSPLHAHNVSIIQTNTYNSLHDNPELI